MKVTDKSYLTKRFDILGNKNTGDLHWATQIPDTAKDFSNIKAIITTVSHAEKM